MSKGGTAQSAASRFVDGAVRKEMCAGSGQVAQVVERSPEKAGVGGSTPSLATKLFILSRLHLILNPIHRIDIS